jgi:hypothetical protein
MIARLLLTLPSHGHPVTALRFAGNNDSLTLLSGDAVGKVLVHALQ